MTGPRGVSLHCGETRAVDDASLDIPTDHMVGLISPDGVGKSSLLTLSAGARKIQDGETRVLDDDMRDRHHHRAVYPRIAYMPRGLGKNLYPTLSVFENADLFGRLFGHDKAGCERRIVDLLQSIGLAPFAERPAGKLSGGMKQKLGLCCALIHDPDPLALGEPTTGVDPLSCNQFQELIGRIRAGREGMSMPVVTAYTEEAEHLNRLVAMNDEKVLATGMSQELRECTGTQSLESAFITLLPGNKRVGRHRPAIPPRPQNEGTPRVAIEAEGPACCFGDFVAIDHVSFRIECGEIFDFLGSNGCGESTTMKMLTGLLPASEGTCVPFGQAAGASDMVTRHRVGYMSQAFSLYAELNVRQNLVLHARLSHLSAGNIPIRVGKMFRYFDLEKMASELPDDLPPDIRQCLSLAMVAIHRPEILILGKLTLGVDPVARDGLWELVVELSCRDGVTIFISTHLVSETQYCDHISLIHADKVLASDTPDELMRQRGLPALEAAFIAYLEETAGAATPAQPAEALIVVERSGDGQGCQAQCQRFSPLRPFSYACHKTMELHRDPIRLTLIPLDTTLLTFIIGYSINMGVEDLSWAILGRDQATTSQICALNIAGSRYFVEHTSITNSDDLDQCLRSGEPNLAVKILSDFGRDLKHGSDPAIDVWIDKAMPTRANTVLGYVQGLRTGYLADLSWQVGGVEASAVANIGVRHRYNSDMKSLKVMVPAVIPLLLITIPVMLIALGMMREKELGSVADLYVIPVTRLRFLAGRQPPYVATDVVNFPLMLVLAIVVFHVPLKGSLLALTIGAFLYVVTSTGLKLFLPAFIRNQIAAISGVAIATMIPAIQLPELIYPMFSLKGAAARIGRLYPTSHLLVVSRGAFSKLLGLSDLWAYYLLSATSIVVLTLLSMVYLRKQED